MHKNAQDSVVGWGKDFQFIYFQKEKGNDAVRAHKVCSGGRASGNFGLMPWDIH
jgi:hypothetical protein